jgi:hypothetical protein
MDKCPDCNGERIEKVIIKFMNNQEQKVNLCRDCKKIFREVENLKNNE